MDVISVPHTTQIAVFRLVLATVLGAAVGVNRELFLKPAGLRTHALVALGASLFAIVALLLTPSAGADFTAVSRIVQGLVAGVGFIGGGVIIRRDDPQGVHGVSTAASIWVSSAIGLSAGLGLWRAALAAVALAVVVLSLTPLDRKLREWREVQPPR